MGGGHNTCNSVKAPVMRLHFDPPTFLTQPFLLSFDQPHGGMWGLLRAPLLCTLTCEPP